MNESDLHVVLGASGGAGNAIARALDAAGHPTRGVNRSGSADLPKGIEVMAADITTTAGVAMALDGAHVVYMAAQPRYHRWAQEFPAMTERVLAESGRVGAKFVMVDNLYMYGKGHPLLGPSTTATATDRKGTVRRAMFDMVMHAHHSGDVTATIGQASDYFGPRADNSAVTALAIEPAVGSGTLRWMGSLDVPHSVAYLPDIARAFVLLGTSPEADGRAWVLPHGPAVTGRQFLDDVERALGDQRKVSVVSTTMLRIASPFHRISRESLGVAYQWSEPWIADDTAFQSTFGPFTCTPLGDAIAETVTWYRRTTTPDADHTSSSMRDHNAST